MSRPPTRLVVDASIATKWFLDDEQHANEADELLRLYRSGLIELYAPDHIRYEVGSALGNPARRERITNEQGRRALQMFLAWQIPTVANEALLGAAYDIAIKYE